MNLQIIKKLIVLVAIVGFSLQTFSSLCLSATCPMRQAQVSASCCHCSEMAKENVSFKASCCKTDQIMSHDLLLSKVEGQDKVLTLMASAVLVDWNVGISTPVSNFTPIRHGSLSLQKSILRI